MVLYADVEPYVAAITGFIQVFCRVISALVTWVVSFYASQLPGLPFLEQTRNKTVALVVTSDLWQAVTARDLSPLDTFVAVSVPLIMAVFAVLALLVLLHLVACLNPVVVRMRKYKWLCCKIPVLNFRTYKKCNLIAQEPIPCQVELIHGQGPVFTGADGQQYKLNNKDLALLSSSWLHSQRVSDGIVREVSTSEPVQPIPADKVPRSVFNIHNGPPGGLMTRHATACRVKMNIRGTNYTGLLTAFHALHGVDRLRGPLYIRTPDGIDRDMPLMKPLMLSKDTDFAFYHVSDVDWSRLQISVASSMPQIKKEQMLTMYYSDISGRRWYAAHGRFLRKVGPVGSVEHNCSTPNGGGASGSPIFIKNSVVAVHYAGEPLACVNHATCVPCLAQGKPRIYREAYQANDLLLSYGSEERRIDDEVQDELDRVDAAIAYYGDQSELFQVSQREDLLYVEKSDFVPLNGEYWADYSDGEWEPPELDAMFGDEGGEFAFSKLREGEVTKRVVKPVEITPSGEGEAKTRIVKSAEVAPPQVEKSKPRPTQRKTQLAKPNVVERDRKRNKPATGPKPRKLREVSTNAAASEAAETKTPPESNISVRVENKSRQSENELALAPGPRPLGTTPDTISKQLKKRKRNKKKKAMTPSRSYQSQWEQNAIEL